MNVGYTGKGWKGRIERTHHEEGFKVVQRKKRRVAFEKLEKEFRKVDNMTDKELEEIENKKKRFTRRMEKYVITARLKKEQSMNNRNTNTLRIGKQVKKDGVKPDKVLENSFTVMDLKFIDMEEANKCLEIMEQGKGDMMYSIRNRAMQCREVVASWDRKVEEFLSEVDEKENILNCERMKSKKMDMEKGMYSWTSSGLLLVTFKGSNVPQKVQMYNGLVRVPVDHMWIQLYNASSTTDLNIGKISVKGKEYV